MILTDAQQTAYDRLLTEWTTVGEPSPMIGGGCVMVEVTGEQTGNTMWLGIETDGYTHS
tara:strand:- start:1254 stop:1430 length:177 start_codon:yes stop_codon:yes gene_type:complete